MANSVQYNAYAVSYFGGIYFAGSPSSSDFNITVSDAVITSENIATNPVSFVAVHDNSAFSEAVAIFENVPSSVQVGASDSVTTAESINVLILVLFIAVSDSTTTSENTVVRVPTLLIVVNDSSHVDEYLVNNPVGPDIQVDPNPGDSASTSENVVALIPIINLSVNDSVNSLESIFTGEDESLRLSDSASVSEAVGYYGDLVATRESVTVVIPGGSVIFDTITTSEFVNVRLTVSVIIRSSNLMLTVPGSINFTVIEKSS